MCVCWGVGGGGGDGARRRPKFQTTFDCDIVNLLEQMTKVGSVADGRCIVS